MADRPFGFGPPGGQGSGSGSGGSGSGGGSGSSGSGSSGGSGGGGEGGPFGPLGDPQQFADALRQFADLMSWQGGPVNWDLAKNVARHAVAADGDPSVLDVDRQKVADAVRLADLWLDEATGFPSGVRQAQAWSRSEWVEATLPVWSKLCDPIADKAVDAMGGMLTENPAELGAGLPEEMTQALQAIGGGLSGLSGMMRRIGGMMVGSQTGAAVGALAREVVSSTDVGLPLGPEGTAALLPAGVAAFGEGLSIDPDEIRLFLALREAAHHRLFAHVPWLRAHLLGAVADYARGITVDASLLRDAMPQIDPSNPEALQEALADAAVFQPEDTPQQKAALARLETALALVEGWVATVVEDAAGGRLPQERALAEAIRRRRATGGPAERTFATLVGLELRPRRLREAADIWRRLTQDRGISGREAVWSHPDLLPTADDFDDPAGFVQGRPELSMSEFDEAALDELANGGPGPAKPDSGKPDSGKPDSGKPDSDETDSDETNEGKPDADKPGQG
jgi:putative hydrolase